MLHHLRVYASAADRRNTFFYAHRFFLSFFFFSFLFFFFSFFFPTDDNLGVLKSIRVQLRVWGWAGVGACGGEGVGGRPDPPDGRKSGPYFSLYTTSAPTGLPRAERWMIDFQNISERKWCKLGDFRGFTIGKVIIGRFSDRKCVKARIPRGRDPISSTQRIPRSRDAILSTQRIPCRWDPILSTL